MILGSPPDVERFLKTCWRKSPGLVQIPPAKIAGLLGSLAAVTPEILFDRTARTSDRSALTVLGEPLPAVQGDTPAGWWATGQFRGHGKAIELLRIESEWENVRRFCEALEGELATPMESTEASFLVLPKGYRLGALRIETDTFFLQVLGTGARLGAIETRLGGLAYFPKGSQIDLNAADETLLIRLRLIPAVPFKMISDFLAAKLAARPEWTEPLTGILGFGDESEASRERLEKLLRALPEELAKTHVEEVLGVEAAEPRKPPAKQRPGSHAFAGSESIYENREWGVPPIARRPEDICIATYKRSGTTWLQMIFFQLLTDGDLSKIGHIYEFSPYPFYELKILGSSRRIDSLASPRVFKTHLPFEWLYGPTGRYIYVARDGMDVAVSAFHHHHEVGNAPVPFEVFIDRFLTEKRGWFDHVEGWWNNRQRPGVLFLTYRGLKEDLAGNIARIAEFLGLKSPDLARAVKKSSFENMKKHESKFHHNAGIAWLLGRRETSGFIRQGKLSEGRSTFTAEERQRFQARYQARLGHTDLGLDQ